MPDKINEEFSICPECYQKLSQESVEAALVWTKLCEHNVKKRYSLYSK
jgi:hypothetical protein